MSGRRAIFQIVLLPLFAGLILAAGTGCTAEAKKARRLAKAVAYYQAGDLEKAEIEYKNVLQLDANNAEAISHLGLIFFDQGRTGVTATFLTKARELQPDNLDVRVKFGMLLSGNGKRVEAREQAMYVLERRPNDEDAPLLLVETLTQPKDVPEIRKALQKLPSAGGAPVLLALGLLDLREGKTAEAEANFKQAKALAPKSGAVAYAWAMLYSTQKNLPEAAKAFAEASELSPVRSPRRIRYVQFLLQTSKPDEAKKVLTEITQKAPDSVNGWFFLANLAVSEKKWDDCLASLTKVLALDQFHHDALLLRSSVKFNKGEKDVAIMELERQSKVFPKSAEMHFQLGRFYLSTNNAEKAAASFTEGLTYSPDATGIVMALAELNLRMGKPELTVKAMVPLIQKNPAIAEARLLLAAAYRVQGNLDGALAVYKQFETAFAPNPRPLYLSGLIYLQQRKLDEARAAFTKSLEIEPGFLPSLEQMVNYDISQKKFPQARQRVEAQVAKNPKSAELQVLLANACIAGSDKAAGEAALLKIVELQPELPAGYVLLSRFYIDNGEREKALKNLDQAVAKNPKSVEALMLRAAMYELQSDFPNARANYEKVLEVNPQAQVALNNLAYLYAEKFGDLEKANQLAQKAYELPHGSLLGSNISDTLGWILYKKRQYGRALTLLSESVEKMPNSAEVHYHAGMAYYMTGAEKSAQVSLEQALALGTNFPGLLEAKQSLAILAINPKTGGAEAQATLEKAVAAKPDDPVAQSRLGQIYEQAGAIDKAGAAFETALKANPNNATVALNLIRVHLKRKETAKALELGKATRKIAPDDPEVARILGRLAYSTGDYTWALSLLQECARKLPDDVEALYDLGLAAYAKGQMAAAETALRDALKISELFPRAANAKALLEMMEIAADPARAAGATAKVDQRLKDDPEDVPALMVLGAAQERKPDVGAARKTYEKVLAKYPDFYPAMRLLTIMASKGEGTDPKTEERGAKAREIYPNDLVLAKAVGILNVRSGNFARAKTLLQSSSRELSSDAEVFYYLGKSQIGTNDRPGGVKSMQRALELGLKGDLATDAKKAVAPPPAAKP